MDIWDYFKSLFKKSEESSSSQPFIREAIERSTVEIADYDLWKRTRGKDQMLSLINEQYAHFLIEPAAMNTLAMDVLHTPSTKGFVLYYDEYRDNEKDFIHLFDYLKERVMELGYVLYMSDTRTYTKSLWVETVQRHYLKPPLKNNSSEEGKFYQRFGNILIELLFRNDKLVNLKFRANTYHDHKFEKAESFTELVRAVSKINS